MFFQLVMPSIGLAYLASSLQSEGHEVSVIDAVGEGLHNHVDLPGKPYILQGLDFDQVIERIPHGADVIGITYMFSNEWYIQKTLVKKIKEMRPNAKIILGGEAASADAEFILKSNVGVDFCVIGEGEETFNELVAAFAQGKPADEISGLAFLNQNNEFTQTTRRKRMKDFSHLLPAWELFPIQNYLDLKSGMDIQNRSCLPILASRGCPHSCHFCSSPTMWGFTYSNRKPDAIVAEMAHWKKLYPDLEHFTFVDLSMTLSKDWTIEFAEKLTASGLNVSWNFGPGTRTEVMNEKVIDALYKSGLTKIGFASESGSEETLKRVNKKIKLGTMLDSMRYANKINMASKATIIYGFPGQTWKEIFKGFQFIFKMALCGVDDLGVYFFSPYPGSQLHQELMKAKKIPDKSTDIEGYEKFLDELSFANRNLQSWSDELDSKYLKPLHLFTHLSFLFFTFLLNPKKIILLYKNVKAKKPRTSFESLVYSKIYKNTYALKLKVKDNEPTALTAKRQIAG
ncbi:MAG: B12-binding domain-containing radical SAM protein [Pseudobdellovibrio sp.]